MDVYDAIGGLGALLLVTAYFLLTTKKLSSHAVPYQLMNLVAAGMLMVYNVHKAAHVGLFINAFWATIAIAGLVWHKKHHRQYKLERRPKPIAK